MPSRKNTAILLTGLMLAGCASLFPSDTPMVNANAFTPDKKFAVVSIASLKSFEVGKGLSQVFKSPDAFPQANTQPLIDQLAPRIIQALGDSKQFTLLPEEDVIKGKAYHYLAEDEKSLSLVLGHKPVNVASGYKYIADEEKYPLLAPYLGVDGVIGITMQFAIFPSKSYYVDSKFNSENISFYTMTSDSVQRMNDLSLTNQSNRPYSAIASIAVVAYNKYGELVWKDSFVQEPDPYDVDAIVVVNTAGITNADFEKFQVTALKVGEKAVATLLARYASMMAGNDIPRMRSIK